MPVSGLFSSIANKAQTAIGQHLPSQRPASPDAAAQPSANESAAGGAKNHTLEALQYQIRSLGQQYSSSTTAVQKIITIAKGTAIDLDSLSRDAKAGSKEMYTWGQGEDADIKDVTDRLAYLNFVQGSLASSLADKLNAARAPLKALRDAENALTPRRNQRSLLGTQVTRLQHENKSGTEKKLAELREQIRKAEEEDKPAERELELLKRKAIRESESLKWEAVREYGEKLVLLSQAAPPIIEALPIFPPTAEQPYTGAHATGAARASLQRTLDNYKIGHVSLPLHDNSSGTTLSRKDTMSFGESHKDELEYIGSPTSIEGSSIPGIPITPPATTGHGTGYAPPAGPPPSHLDALHARDSATSPPVGKSMSPPINPAMLNQAPATIPSSSSIPGVDHDNGEASITSPIPIAAPHPEKPIVSAISTSPTTISNKSAGDKLVSPSTGEPVLPPVHPTIAETGSVISNSGTGPGPASGNLKDLKAQHDASASHSGIVPTTSSTDTAPATYGDISGAGESKKFESAEEEKRRLAAEYSQAGAPVPKYEDKKDGNGDEPPSYQDY